jgi:hypothetical protein
MDVSPHDHLQDTSTEDSLKPKLDDTAPLT